MEERAPVPNPKMYLWWLCVMSNTRKVIYSEIVPAEIVPDKGATIRILGKGGGWRFLWEDFVK